MWPFRESRPIDFLRILQHRILHKQWWLYYGGRRFQNLSDQGWLNILGETGTIDEIVGRFHERVRFRFFFHSRNKKDFFLHLLTQTEPYEQILEEAQNTVENRFETLGSGTIDLGDKINWHRDFKSGREWPLGRMTPEQILDLKNPSDIKVPWELSRFHQVWWLGKAYWLTRSESYAEKFKGLIESWIADNPVGLGPNWANAMEAAIRACNWIAAYYFFSESPSLSSQFWISFLKSLFIHGEFVQHNLEYSWRNHNHLLANLTGLVFLGVFFKDTAGGKQWLETGRQGLEREMEEQVHPDGVDYEKSVAYHGFVLELFYAAAILCEKNHLGFSSRYLRRLEAMFEFVLHYIRPDGSAPAIGDTDDGRLFRLCMQEETNDHRHALSVGAILFDRSDFHEVAGSFHQEALWYFGGEGFEKHLRLRGPKRLLASRDFPYGGFYVLRSPNAHLMIDAGELGMRGRRGHGHNDTFSFELWADGALLIVDSGTYAYTSDVGARNELRSSRAHNSVVVDGEEIASFDSLWSVRRDGTLPKVLQWETTPELDILEAEHSGYRRLPFPVRHRRRFEFRKEKMYLKITDSFYGTGPHMLETFLHFAPSVGLDVVSTTNVIATTEHGDYGISATMGEFSLLETWYSRRYGIREQNRTLVLKNTIQTPSSIIVEIVRNA